MSYGDYSSRIRTTRAGYADFGPQHIPPYPELVVLTDRNDGSQWLVGVNVSPPERLSIISPYVAIKAAGNVVVYDKDSGPYFATGNGLFKLMLRGGRIGLEYNAFPPGVKGYSSAPIYPQSLARDQRVLDISTVDPLTAHLEYPV